MHCKTCKKRMMAVSTSCELNCGGNTCRVIHVPAGRCPECGKIEISNQILENAKRYVRDYPAEIIDYVQCEEVEIGNLTALIVSQLLW